MIYAEVPAKRSRQLLADAAVAAWTVGWVVVGVVLHRTIALLAGPGRAVADAGRRLSDAASGGGDAVADLPLVGGALAAPFERVGAAGGGLVDAGQSAQDVVAWLSVWPVVLVVAVPILVVLLAHLALRARWAREARAVARLRGRDGAEALLALRALAHRRVGDLTRVVDDPHAAYVAGDHAPLAALELRTLGLRRQGQPPGGAAGG